MRSLSWSRDGSDWPNREASGFVTAAGVDWHVQRAGHGPALLLVHGTGASTHSWRDLLPLLSQTFTVLAPDLPGHGFTSALPASRQSLPGMAEAIAALLVREQFAPRVAVGHSAGAALLVRMALDGRIDPRLIVSINGAFLPYGGAALNLLKPVTQLVAASPVTAALLAQKGRDAATVRRLIEGTGSRLDARGLELYARLVGAPGHVAGALTMMAGWDLRPLLRELPGLRQPLAMLVGTSDRTIRPAEAERVRELVPQSTSVPLRGLGHLAHEERPQLVARLICELASAPVSGVANAG